VKRTLIGHPAKSQILLGLRGVGKTVLLNRINQIAENEGCQTVIFEADPTQSLPEIFTVQLQRILLKLDRRKKVGDDIQTTIRLLRSFASAFKVKYGEFEVGLTHETATGELSIDLTDIFVSIGIAARKRETAVLILIDEMQFLSRSDLSALIVALHKTSQQQLPLLFFGAGLPQIAKLSGEAKSYSERLFEFPKVDKLDHESAIQALVKPVEDAGYKYEMEAINHILLKSDRYPFFLQVWGSHIWEIANASPFSLNDALHATERAYHALDQGFFKVRYDRLTERQKQYMEAMAMTSTLPAKSAQVSDYLNISVNQAAPIRDELIKKGIAYSPTRGLVDFTVPGFREFLQRYQG